MRIAKLLAIAGLTMGALAFAAPAFASTTDNPDYAPCVNVVTPPIANLTYITNTNPETVAVTLTGNYYWVQVKEVGGKIDYLGPTTSTVILTPGEGISLAWGGSQHKSTIAGPHTWLWTGLQDCTYPVYPRTYPCHHRNWQPDYTSWTNRVPCQNHRHHW